MPAFPSVFPLWWIAITATLAGIISFVIVRWRYPALSMLETAVVALIVGISVLAWRLTGNIPTLNNDPIAGFSPNDWLCPMITYVCLGLYAAFYPPTDPARWAQTRALLTIAAFVVNVLVI
jgi:hypothetical protein